MGSSSKNLLSTFLVLYLFLQIVVEASLSKDIILNEGGAGIDAINQSYGRPKINCNFACARRCLKASRKNVCRRACGACCTRCHCVPPGFYGNKNLCPCYASLRTRGHKPKCP